MQETTFAPLFLERAAQPDRCMVAVHRSPVCLQARLIKLLSAFLPRSGSKERFQGDGSLRGGREKVSSSSSSSSSSIVEILGWSKRKNTTKTPAMTLSSRDRSRSHTKPHTFISVLPIGNTEYSKRVAHTSRGGGIVNNRIKMFGDESLRERRGRLEAFKSRFSWHTRSSAKWLRVQRRTVHPSSLSVSFLPRTDRSVVRANGEDRGRNKGWFRPLFAEVSRHSSSTR